MKPNYCICFGEVLWDMLPQGKMPGGAPMNVALHLLNLGVDAKLISRVKNDLFGIELKKFLQDRNCSDRWIQIENDLPTGSVEVNLADKNNAKYEIIFPVAWDNIEFSEDMKSIYENAFAIVFGSLSCRFSNSRETLFKLLHETKALKIFDVNLRAPHFSKEMIIALLSEADLVKINEEELIIIGSWLEISAETLEQKVKAIKEKFNLEAVIVTLGAEGAMLMNKNGLFRSEKYKVEVKDTIGSGDAFLAGFIKSLINGKSENESLNYASALGALVAASSGATPQISENEIFQLTLKK